MLSPAFDATISFAFSLQIDLFNPPLPCAAAADRNFGQIDIAEQTEIVDQLVTQG